MSDLEQLFEARRAIDRELFEKHSREVGVLFTDIVGSTQYFEAKGDIDGLALLRRHNELLFPLVEQYDGRVIKTVGDAIMAIFEQSANAVRCAVAMQQALAAANREPGAPEIHIRVGGHCGRVMVDNDDVFGDTVNTAARVVHAAAGDEVLVSRELFDRLPPAEGYQASSRGDLPLKGKAEPLPVAVVDWRRSAPSARAAAADTAAPEVFVLEIGVGRDGLRVAAVDGALDKGTVKAYSELPIALEAIDGLASAFAPFVAGTGAIAYADQIRACGEALFARCLSDRARRHLLETELGFVRLHLDDRLVHVPWELAHDGRAFLGQRFALGRMVTARSDEAPSDRAGAQAAAGHALVVSNPAGDLEQAEREGAAVAAVLAQGFAGEVRHLEGPVTRAAFLQALAGCRWLHFAGHGRPLSDVKPGGLQLADGLVAPDEVAAAVGAGAPRLVFVNACHASTGGGWTETARGVYNLASALLTRGTRHYLAPLWQIPDDDALSFALRFYEQLLAAQPVGEAMRLARGHLKAPASAGGYALYGEPRAVMPDVMAAQPTRKVRSARTGTFAVPRRIAGAGEAAAVERRRRALGVPVVALALLGAVIAVVGLALVARIAISALRTPVSASATLQVETHRPTPAVSSPRTAAAVVPATPPPPAAIAAVEPERSGPVRLAMLPFKNLTGDPALDVAAAAVAETLTTEFGQVRQVRLIERGQIDVDIREIEFGQSKYVDPATRAAIGKIAGAEVVVLGSFQRAGPTLRANARLVDVASGEVVAAVRVEQPLTRLLRLQDELAASLRQATIEALPRLRP
ncbi:MAG: CHAT domain-containing protein [Deltaproteobacteria bacterium]|nr:CHAT domain-containing protein [Deltaproteobacteria bacterium]